MLKSFLNGASFSCTRGLGKSQLGGVIFGTNKMTINECLHKQLFGLPKPHMAYVKRIEPGLPLFLFNYTDRTLLGIFEAASSGQENLDPYAWTCAELSLKRLKALAKFAFGMGLTQVVLSTLAFTAFELPPNNAIGTQILQFLFHSRSDLVNIRSIDEAIVIGAALSLSSSAFVLQLLAEKGELATRLGSATLGILLLQESTLA